MKPKKHKYKQQRQQERKRIEEDKEYIRPKRASRSLWDDWDSHHTYQNTWKVKREKKYRVGSRGKRHEYIIKYSEPRSFGRRDDWEFRDYCNKHQIPFRIEQIYGPRKIVRGVYGPYYLRKHIGAKLIWWSDKDIGIEQILGIDK